MNNCEGQSKYSAVHSFEKDFLVAQIRHAEFLRTKFVCWLNHLVIFLGQNAFGRWSVGTKLTHDVTKMMHGLHVHFYIYLFTAACCV